MPKFRCQNGHTFEEVVESDVTAAPCKCGATAAKLAVQGAPSVKSGERISRDEARQAAMQFGYRPKNRDELKVLLKEKNMTTVSAREFEDLSSKPKPEPPPMSSVEKSELISRVKARREGFRSAYDSGSIPKPSASEEVKQAAASEFKGE